MKRARAIKKEFYVNEKENEQIKNNMKKANKNNFSLYARELVLNGEIKLIDFDLIRSARYEISKVGTNINQVVKLCHEKRNVTSEDLEKIINLQTELMKKISSLINSQMKKEDLKIW